MKKTIETKNSIKEKIVMTTWASSGMGEAVARHLAAACLSLSLAARRKNASFLWVIHARGAA